MKKVLHIFTLFETPKSFFDGQFRYLADNGYDIHLITSYDDRAVSFAQRNAIKYSPVVISRTISPVKDVKAIFKVCRYILKEHIDIVFGHTPKGAMVAMIASFICGVRHRIYYRHGLVYVTKTGFAKCILKQEERLVSLLSTKIINVSPSLAEFSVQEKLNGRKKQICLGKGTCGGIDVRYKFNPENINNQKLEAYRKQFGIKENDFIFGFCGRICKDKGIIELIEAFRMFKSEQSGSKLLLIGHYDSRDILPNDKKNEIENEEDIIVTGYVDQDIEYYYSLIDVFIFPSHREGFGMSVIEASAMRKPVLVSRSCGCIDSIVEGETGLYIDLEPKSIYDGMKYFLEKEKIVKYGDTGRKFVLKNFDHTVVWPFVLDLYRKME
ncbi:MAG: glycosyltransferase family 4 protein [Bacteroidales bacterium]|nr:glycosyltransferase family 4 protein [Bacteroidales bacterium]